MIVIDNNLIVSFVEYYEIIDIIMGRDFAPGALFVRYTKPGTTWGWQCHFYGRVKFSAREEDSSSID
jgi:hypothetical protein